MMDQVIHFLHICVVIGSILIPILAKSKQMLVLYSFLVPFAMFHWVINDDTCCLTKLEQFARGDPDDSKTFFGAFIKPIYNVPDDTAFTLLKIILFGLWFLTQFRLVRPYMKI